MSPLKWCINQFSAINECWVIASQRNPVLCTFSIGLHGTAYHLNSLIGGSGEILFVNQSNFFLNNNADRHPSSRNTQQEYSFHLYCGGASPTKHTILTILCNYAPASGKSRPVSPNASHSWFKHLDSLHIYSIGAAIRKNDEWNSLDGPKWRHTLTSVQIQCTVRWNYARWGQIWTYKKKKKKKKNDCRGAGSLSTCRRYVLTHYFEGLMELTCVAGEIRRTAMSKHRKKWKSKFVNLTAPAATF